MSNKTDRFRIVPHTPFVYRVERLYYVDVEYEDVYGYGRPKIKTRLEEDWRALHVRVKEDEGIDDNDYKFMTIPNRYGLLYTVKHFDTPEDAKFAISYITAKEIKENDFMAQEPIYFDGKTVKCQESS